MELDLIKTIAQLGGTGVGVFALWIFYRLAGNHLAHLTKAIDRLTDVIIKLEKKSKK